MRILLQILFLSYISAYSKFCRLKNWIHSIEQIKNWLFTWYINNSLIVNIIGNIAILNSHYEDLNSMRYRISHYKKSLPPPTHNKSNSPLHALKKAKKERKKKKLMLWTILEKEWKFPEKDTVCPRSIENVKDWTFIPK